MGKPFYFAAVVSIPLSGGSRCSDNRYSDNRAVGLDLISVFDHHGRKQLGLGPKYLFHESLHPCSYAHSPIYGRPIMSNRRFQFSVTVRDRPRRVGYVDRQT